MVIAVNHAEGSLGRLSEAELAIQAMINGRPELTARPPTFAMNIRTEVRMVISSVSRVSEELSAP